MGDVGVVVERGPLQGVVAVAIGLGEGVPLPLHEPSQLLEVAVGRGGAHVDDDVDARIGAGVRVRV